VDAQAPIALIIGDAGSHAGAAHTRIFTNRGSAERHRG
jgi:hypothetical protein